MITATMAFGWSGFATSLEDNIKKTLLWKSYRATVTAVREYENIKIKGTFPLKFNATRK